MKIEFEKDYLRELYEDGKTTDKNTVFSHKSSMDI
jgi:hypothetical protein